MTENQFFNKPGENDGFKSIFTGFEADKGINRHRIERAYEKLAEKYGKQLKKEFVADIFASLYLPIPLVDNEKAEDVAKNEGNIYTTFIKEIIKKSEMFRRMHSEALADPDLSSEHAQKLATDIIETLLELENDAQDSGSSMQDNTKRNKKNSKSGQKSGLRDDSNIEYGQPQPGSIGPEENGKASQNDNKSYNANESQKKNSRNGNSKEDGAEKNDRIDLNRERTKENAKKLLDSLLSRVQKKSSYFEKNALDNILKRLEEMGKKKDIEYEEMNENGKRDKGEAKKGNPLKHGADASKPGTGHSISYDDELQKIMEMVKDINVSSIMKVLERIEGEKYEGDEKIAGVGSITGYGVGSNIRLAIPSQFAYPDIVFLLKFASDSLTQYDKYFPIGEKAPLFLLVDKSGSMSMHYLEDKKGSATRFDIAKVVALKLCIKAISERRSFHLMFFDSETWNLQKLMRGSKKNEQKEFLSNMGKVSANSNAGTRITNAIIDMCGEIQKVKSKNRLDIILITDGEDEIDMVEVQKKLKEANANLITIAINFLEREDLTSLILCSKKYFKAGIDKYGYTEVIQKE